MSIFVYTENINGSYKKTALEAVSYAKSLAEKSGTDVVAVSINPTDASDVLYKYGANKVIVIKNDSLNISMLSLMPVSYTHPDVYKRQGNYCIFMH